MTISTGPTVLHRILETKKTEVSELRPQMAELRARALELRPARDFHAALSLSREVAVLAEIKRRSPSAGPIRPDALASEVAEG